MPAMTRGPLPPGVYWRRRLFVGLLALSIVFVIATALGLGSDGSSDDAPVAQQAGAEATHTVTLPPEGGATTAPTTSTPTAKATKGKKNKRAEPELAAPSGNCAAGDVRVTPVTERAVAGRPIELTLSLQTRTDPACHWRVGKQRLAVRVSGDGGEVWSTRHCQQAIPSQQVVLRREVATELTITWDARRSSPGCPDATEWVLPGEYVVTAAALGGEPREQALRLVAPQAGSAAPDLPAEVKTGNALDRIKQRNE
ncbi:hypothetical protein KUV85_15700 [Nocardioides panacisoli]|uniref:hypothetical protein n=1 Tax=Nocardioides panacisoli TaxID=627624 RepID=UPI001C639DC4|nr:hypothetical protein [Nocardioides panacisoli]QYJ03751.1 hypothetical protein KUV85_15700 [Nocardioides panacisoli]